MRRARNRPLAVRHRHHDDCREQGRLAPAITDEDLRAAHLRSPGSAARRWRNSANGSRHILCWTRSGRSCRSFGASSSFGLRRVLRPRSLAATTRSLSNNPLFGDFACDLVVGHSAQNAFCFIEFEDAGPTSLFIQRGKRVTRDWSPRFEHGYSQIIDWFHKVDDMRRSDDLIARFGTRSISFPESWSSAGINVLSAGESRATRVAQRQRRCGIEMDTLP